MTVAIAKCYEGRRHKWHGSGSSRRCLWCGRWYWGLIDQARTAVKAARTLATTLDPGDADTATEGEDR